MPPYTPEFSAIESLFAFIKSKLKDFKFSNKLILANRILQTIFKAETDDITGFFQQTLNEMIEFHSKQDGIEILNDYKKLYL